MTPATVFPRFRSALERIEAEFGNLAHQAGDTVDEELATAQHDAMAFLDALKAHAIQHPEPLFALLRKVKPILIVKEFALVTRFEDVQEVLARDDVFQVTYDEKMRVITGGNDFFLGMQNSPEYTRDVAHMRSVIRREDIPRRIAPFIEKQATELVAAAGSGLDVVKQLSKTVPARWVGEYFGCTPTSEEELAGWGSAIFQFLFTDLKNDAAVGKAAREAALGARGWLDRTIAERKAKPSERDDVLGRCLALQSIGAPGLDDLGIRNNLLGLLTGAIPTTSKCCAQALDQLLDRPEALRGAQEAARVQDDALLAQYVFEALRFNPNNPGVFRIAAEDYTVAKGSLRATVIRKGMTVLPATQSAMFDERIVDHPNEFQIGRPAYLDMHFGYGLHTCFGQYVNRVQIPGILKPLLCKQRLRRAGELKYEGPFPSSLPVQFD
ncbi:MAG: cytochrome P450 [Bryobacteraceae bacterium]